MNKLISVLIVATTTLLIQLITILPWWSFVIPACILGVMLPFRKWKMPSFAAGFIAGCLVWVGTTLFFNNYYAGKIMDKVALMIGLPQILLIVIIGIIGGIITGLAVYTGESIRSQIFYKTSL